jgi:anaerobic carbon-monoxide dehydrogenase iron sulfur subunit
MRKIYIKESACIGCRLCEVYCRLEHSRSDDLVKAFKRESPSAISRCLVEVNKPVSLSVRCRSCEDAPCVRACLTGALQRDPITGIVAVDEEKCIGCWTCILSCPFGAVRRDTQLGKIIKCDLCGDKEIPVCVSNCPNEALVCEYE